MIANYISLIRVVLIPVFILLLTTRPPMFTPALVVFIVAVVSDAIDGLVARKTNSNTSFGRFLDPMSDKLLIVSAFITLIVMGYIPIWLGVLVFFRDLFLFLGWIGIYISTGLSLISPSVLGKITTVFQMFTIILVLMNLRYEYLNIMYLLTAAFTCVSGVHYFSRTVKSLPGEIKAK